MKSGASHMTYYFDRRGAIYSRKARDQWAFATFSLGGGRKTLKNGVKTLRVVEGVSLPEELHYKRLLGVQGMNSW